VPLFAADCRVGIDRRIGGGVLHQAFGIVFLGEPRSERVLHAHEVDWTMRLPMLILRAGCVLIGLFAPVVVGSLKTVFEERDGLQHQKCNRSNHAKTTMRFIAWRDCR